MPTQDATFKCNLKCHFEKNETYSNSLLKYFNTSFI